MTIKLLCAITLLAAPCHAATFGDQTAYTSNVTLRDNVAMSPASPSESGVCDSITAYLKFNFDSCKVRCALYTIAGNDTVLVPNSVTEERWFATSSAFIWHGFAFSNPRPTVVAGGTYFIAAFADTAGNGSSGLARGAIGTGGGVVIQRSANYEDGFPSPINPTSSITANKYSIYVTYTPIAASLPRRRHITSRRHSAP